MIETKLSKKGKREINHLYFKGLLLDFVENKLDQERKIAFEKFTNENPESKIKIENYKKTLKYLDDFSNLEISNALVEKVQMHQGYWAQLTNKIQFYKWPLGLRWSLEALSVIFIVSTIVILIPWDKIDKIDFKKNQSVILTQIDREKSHSESQMLSEFEKKEAPQFEDEKSKTMAASTESTDKNTVIQPDKVDTKAEAKQAIPVEDSITKEKSITTGYLYRSTFAATNIEVVGPKITEKILSLGGRKAGEVALGWKKTENSIYYHFTIPEAKYQELQDFLNLYGKSNLVKEKHPRVMPEGIIRLIITIEEAAKK